MSLFRKKSPKSPKNYRLVYFNCRARGEVCRLILIQAGVDFQDERVEFEEWPDLKCDTTWGTLPELHMNGTELSQSMAIARYLAREHGLAGKSSWQQALVDSVVDALYDIYRIHAEWFSTHDEEKKAEVAKRKREVVIPTTLANLQYFMEKHNAGNSYLVGNTITWADLYFLVISDYFPPGTLNKFPKLAAILTRLHKQPRIAEWIKDRPETPI